MANVELDELASAVMAELEEYAQYTAEALKESVKEAGTAVRDHLRSNSPRDSGDYAKSWTVKVTEMPHGSKVLVHSRNRYILPSLACRGDSGFHHPVLRQSKGNHLHRLPSPDGR